MPVISVVFNHTENGHMSQCAYFGGLGKNFFLAMVCPGYKAFKTLNPKPQMLNRKPPPHSKSWELLGGAGYFQPTYTTCPYNATMRYLVYPK